MEIPSIKIKKVIDKTMLKEKQKERCKSFIKCIMILKTLELMKIQEINDISS